jgi:hypothetical protein
MRHDAVELERLDVDQPVVGEEVQRRRVEQGVAEPAHRGARRGGRRDERRRRGTTARREQPPLLNPESAMNASAQLKGLS